MSSRGAEAGASRCPSPCRPGGRGGREPAPGPRQLLQRNTVERAFNFNQLRQHRTVATRYDKRDFLGECLKQSGMHWTVNGADAIIALRCNEAWITREAICNTPHT